MRLRITLGILAVVAACGASATAQPPEGRDGPPPEHRDRLRDALDANGDHELDADEIKNAASVLASLDADGNGKIDREEFRPPIRGGGDGFRGRPAPSRERDPGSESRGPREGRPEREREGRPEREREGRPEREREGRPERGIGPRDGAGPRGEGGPSTERVVARAMSFDADGDGKLDKSELEKFAGGMVERMRAARPDREGAGPPRRPEESKDDARPEGSRQAE